ncbi:probable crossover junction endonuclease EME2 isoform X3 [Pongo abelii]|nr:probable crossover junction endonuclease EME2 isoform X3 [Pongo abelii]
MARVGPGRAGVSCRGRGRGRGRGGSGQRRPPTWEISDSDAEGSAGSEAATRARDPAGERRAAAEALRLLRPEQVLKRLAVCVDPAILEDAGADVLMGALEAVGCECRIEPQRPARSLRWTRASPDPCPRSLPPEVWAAGEQELLLLLEPEEFLQGVATLTQISGPTRWVPWISPETTARPHLAVIGLDAYLWSRQHVSRRTQQPERPKVAGAEVAVGWPEVEEVRACLSWVSRVAWVPVIGLLAGFGSQRGTWGSYQLCVPGSLPLARTHQPASSPGPGTPAALGKPGRATGGLVAGAESARVRRYQGTRPVSPQVQYRESQAFSFCTAGHWAAGEPVARDGTGLQAAWRRQIRQFSRVSPAVADAVVTAFPSPRLLQQALEACSTERERMGLLADLPVLPREGGSPRRVGPDLSRRICLFLTTANPDLLLDLGS